MEPQERDLITTLLDRLRSATGQPKDLEADALIRRAVSQQPDAPYYLVQTVLIQEIALRHAQDRIAELEQQLAELPPQRTSFLGGLFGHGQAPANPPSHGPWTRASQSASPPVPYEQSQYAPRPEQAQQGAGGSFLRSAATTAAGIAGGALLFQGISSLFGHGNASGLGAGGYTGGDYGSAGDYGGGGSGDYGGAGDYGGGGDYSGGEGDYGGGDDWSGGADQDYGDGGDWDGGGDDFGGSSC